MKLQEIGSVGDCEVTGSISPSDIYIVKLKDCLVVTEPIKICEIYSDSLLENTVVIPINHIFKTGFGFTKITAIAESVTYKSEQLGSVDKSPVQQNELKFKMLGSSSHILAFKRWIKGENLILLFKDNDLFRQIGSKKYPTKMVEMTAIIDSAVEGENTSELVFRDKQFYDAPYYLGDLTGKVKSFKSDAETITTDRNDITCDID